MRRRWIGDILRVRAKVPAARGGRMLVSSPDGGAVSSAANAVKVRTISYGNAKVRVGR